MSKPKTSLDPSVDYARYPTLSPLPEELLGSFIRCSGCGGSDFRFRLPERKAVCRRCGMPLEDQPKAVSSKPADRPVFQVAESRDHTVVLLPNGTVYAYGDNQYGQCDVSQWRDIVSVAAGPRCSVGLCADGTVKAVGAASMKYYSLDTSDWTNITAIAADDKIYGLLPSGDWMLTGDADWINGLHGDNNCISIIGGRGVSFLMADGTVDGEWHLGYRDDNLDDNLDDTVRKWTEITKVAAGDYHIVGLRSDGTVTAICAPYRNGCPVSKDGMHDECAVGDWRGIKDIAVSSNHTVGLCADGTLKATGLNKKGQCNVSHLQNVKAIAVSDHHTVALLSDGRVEAVGDFYRSSRCNVFDWTDVAEIWACRDFTAARKHDGTILCTDPEIQKRINAVL